MTEITNLSKIKLSVTLIEDGVAWLESDDQQTTADVPTCYHIDDRDFEITSECESYLCHDDTLGQYFISRRDKKILVLYLEQTDLGLEIQEGHIFHEVTKH